MATAATAVQRAHKYRRLRALVISGISAGEREGSRLAGARLGVLFLRACCCSEERRLSACPSVSHPAESSAQRLCQRGLSYQCSIAHRRPRLFSLCLEKKALRVLFLTHNPHSFAKVRSPPTGHHLPPAGCAENRRLAAWPSTQWPKEPTKLQPEFSFTQQKTPGSCWRFLGLSSVPQ